MEEVSDRKVELGDSLNDSQLSAFRSLDRRLQSWLYTYIARSSGDTGIVLAGKIADISHGCRRVESKAVADRYFLTLLKDPRADVPKLAQHVCEFAQLRIMEAFFNFISTVKYREFSSDQLKLATKLFVASRHVIAAGGIGALRRYDQGGKQQLEKTRKGKSVVLTRSGLPRCLGTLADQRAAMTKYFKAKPSDERVGPDLFSRFCHLLESELPYSKMSETEHAALARLVGIIAVSPEISLQDLRRLAKACSELSELEGEERVISLCSASEWGKHSAFPQVCEVTQALALHFMRGEMWREVDAIHKAFVGGKLDCMSLLNELDGLLPNVERYECKNPSGITKLLDRFRDEEFPLSDRGIFQLKEWYVKVESYFQQWTDTSFDDLVKMARRIRARSVRRKLNTEDTLRLTAIGKAAIRLESNKKIILHDTQLLTVLANFLPENADGCLAQVRTGEGKSYIVALLAFVLTMQGNGVHIVSSEADLARRDQDENAQFFSRFSVRAGHICINSPGKQRFRCDVLYGEATDFEFALMREISEDCQLFRELRSTGKRFDYVIVDEADNLTIDTLMHRARIAIPAEERFDWVYQPIFDYVQKHGLRSNAAGLADFLAHYRSGHFRDRAQTLSQSRLNKWIGAVLGAAKKQEKVNYVVAKKTDDLGRVRRVIEIIDVDNTGGKKEGMRWSEGIHEFIEIKHGVEVATESLTSISMSHAVYYGHYGRVFGLSGTLGSHDEREQQQRIYGLSSFDVPTNRPCLRVDTKPRLAKSQSALWEDSIRRITELVSQGRPVLVVCKNIRETISLSKKLLELKILHQLFNECQKESVKKILSKAGQPGVVTVATYKAGRGVDIKLAGKSVVNGGLHVLVTNLPESLRVEGQVRGRAGRQGQPGSSEIIVFPQDGESRSIEELVSRRSRNIQSTSKRNIIRASLDRSFHKFVEQFYGLVAEFTSSMVDREHICALAEELSGCRIEGRPLLPKMRSYVDQVLARQAVELLCAGRSTVKDWLVLLPQLVERVKYKVTVRWGKDCFVPMATQLARRDQDSDQALDQMKEIFCQFHKGTAGLLDPHGAGVVEYLRTVTGAKLPHVGPTV